MEVETPLHPTAAYYAHKHVQFRTGTFEDEDGQRWKFKRCVCGLAFDIEKWEWPLVVHHGG